MKLIGITLVLVLAAVSMAAVPAGAAVCSSCSACAASPCGQKAEPAPCTTGNDMLRKLGRGAANIATAPCELFNQMGKVNCSNGPIAGLTWGLLRGIGMIGVRAVVGVYEVATFPIPCPPCYEPILTDPEFFFEDQSC